MTEWTESRLAEIEALAAKATPGPWTRQKPERDADGWAMGIAVAVTPGRQTIYAHPPGGSFPAADAAYIVAACNAAPGLVAELRAARAELSAPTRLTNMDRAFERMRHASDRIRDVEAENAALRAKLDALVAAAEHAYDKLTEVNNSHVRGSVGFTITDQNARVYCDVLCAALGTLREGLAAARQEPAQ